MDANHIGKKIQSAFNYTRDLLTPVENRWITLIITIFLCLVLRAAGAAGAAEFIALIYIMYWVTLGRSRQERDE